MIKAIKSIYHIVVFCLLMLFLFLMFPIAFLFYGSKKAWLISEVDFDARDNGYHFFKYLRTEQPNVRCYFLISKKNKNYHLIKELGRIIRPHSLKHFLLFISARVKASTLVHGCSPSWLITKYYLTKHHFTGKNIALKHGIFKSKHPNYYSEFAHLDLICCGAKPEYEFIRTNFHYEDGVASYTGLARYDFLLNSSSTNSILIMPTWRRWLDAIESASDFKNSLFFQNWYTFLSNKEFQDIVRARGTKIYFYVHPKLNKYLNEFLSCGNNVVFLNSNSGDDLQLYLKTASLLITDYSSVFFDFAYMKKPTVFYQFDEADYYAKHYEKGYFDYRNDGFGPVCETKERLIEELKICFSNNFSIESQWLKRIDDFFAIRDNKNCARIFERISELINTKSKAS